MSVRSSAKTYFFISRFPPPFGGVSNQVKWLAECLVDQGGGPWQVILLDLKTAKLHRLNDREWCSIPIYRIPKMYTSFFLAIPFFLSYLLSMREQVLRIDPYIGWRFLLIMFGFVISRFLKNEDIRLIYSFHIGAPSLVGGILEGEKKIPHITAVFGESFSNYRKLKSQQRLIAATAGKVVSCSDHCGKMLSAVDSDINYSVLYYGSDLVSLDNNRYRASSNKSQKKTIMFLGRFDAEMGVQFFLDLATSMNEKYSQEFKFVICGQDGKETQTIQKFAREFSGDLTVEISVPFDRRDKLLIAADVLIVPSTNSRACFGLAIVEGLAAGCIVYARDVGGHVESFLGETRFLFGKECSPYQLATIIKKDQMDESVLESLNALREKVIDNFDITTCLENQKQFINQTIGNIAQV